MPTSVRVPGLVLTEHEFDVPLDHGRPEGERITVFAREVAEPGGGEERPFLVFLQGGPGHEAPRPAGRAAGWLGRALRDYRVLLLDQRGTGNSTPVGTLPGRTPAEQAEYLAHFRADSIVRDAELIRQRLGVERWSVLGQSFGGFTSLAYLSQAPEGLREAFFTGGLPPVERHPDEVYKATYATLLERNRRYTGATPETASACGSCTRASTQVSSRCPTARRSRPGCSASSATSSGRARAPRRCTTCWSATPTPRPSRTTSRRRCRSRRATRSTR
ncbi:alpha/beta fold hydrolase [Amycolatopsis sp. NPDC050768]|uniref:alpha/beta fold hydrolase n=1 Tax=Amycolatopsis sp. NPDC050768 TaxID=3154839 RepID=UPI0033D236B5